MPHSGHCLIYSHIWNAGHLAVCERTRLAVQPSSDIADPSDDAQFLTVRAPHVTVANGVAISRKNLIEA
jgi:hypothetical protein